MVPTHRVFGLASSRPGLVCLSFVCSVLVWVTSFSFVLLGSGMRSSRSTMKKGFTLTTVRKAKPKINQMNGLTNLMKPHFGHIRWHPGTGKAYETVTSSTSLQASMASHNQHAISMSLGSATSNPVPFDEASAIILNRRSLFSIRGATPSRGKFLSPPLSSVRHSPLMEVCDDRDGLGDPFLLAFRNP